MGGLGLPELIILALLLIIPAVIFTVIFIIAKSASRSAQRRCPYCAERIQKEANLCRFCGRAVAPL